MTAFVVDDQRLEIAPDDIDDLIDHGQAERVQGIHLGVEFQAGNPVTDVPQTGRTVGRHRCGTALDVLKQQHARRSPDRNIVLRIRELVKRSVVDAIEGAVADPVQKSWHGRALGTQLGCEPGRTQFIDQLKRAVLPVVPEPHGVIDSGRTVSDFRNQPGRVGKGLRHHRPGIATRGIRVFHQRPRPALARRLDAGRLRPPGVMVITGLQVEHLLGLLPAGLVKPVKPALALAARVAFGDHPLDQFRLAVNGVERVLRRQRTRHAGQHVRHQIEADQVEQPEHTGLGNAEWPADGGVGGFDIDAAVDRLDHGALQPVRPNPVSDEAGRVLAVDDGLAQRPVGEVADRVDHDVQGIGAGDDFEQSHVPRRIEEVRDQEMAAERLVHPFGQHIERYRRSVRRYRRPGMADSGDPPVQVALDGGIFDHRLDDPVAIGQPVHVVFGIAGRDQLGVALVHQTCRFGLQ